MRSNEELQALVLDAVGWQNGLDLALIAIEADSSTNAANRARGKGLTEPEIKRTRDLRIALDRALYTPHTLLQELFNNEQNYQQGRHEMPTKTKILRTLAEIWIERDDSIKRSAAESFLKAGFDLDQIEKHLGVQFKWDGSSPPPLDKDLEWGHYFLQNGIFHLTFSTSREDEVGESTDLTLTFDPFTRNQGLTLCVSTSSRGKQKFSLNGVRVISTTLQTFSGGLVPKNKRTIFGLHEEGVGSHIEVEIRKNERDFDIEVRLISGLGVKSLISYIYYNLLPT